MKNLYVRGVQFELNRLKWELEMREKEAELYARALKAIRKIIVGNPNVDAVLESVNV